MTLMHYKNLGLVKLVLGLVLIFSFSLTHAATNFSKSRFKEDIHKIIKKSEIPLSNLGLALVSDKGLEDNRVYFLNEKKLFIPASLTKILPAITSLSEFPQGHKFVTSLHANKQDIIVGSEKKIKGPLYLKGGGDAYFVSESMWKLVNHFVRTNIKIIDGDLIIDDFKFDQLRFDPSREDSRVDRAYDAPIGAMSFNWNSVNVYIKPGENKGALAQVFADPESEYIKIDNETKTMIDKADHFNVRRKKHESKKRDTIIVGGHVNLNSEEKVKYRGISYPDFWSGYQLKSFLNQRGIKVTGEVKKGRVPEGSVLLAELQSEPIALMVQGMMKFSNNYIAEMLTKNLASLKGNQLATLEQGLDVIREYLKKIGISKNEYRLVNPSGLTRKNKFSVFQFYNMLKHVKNNFLIFPEYLNALPISGIDGSLENRMTSDVLKGWVRAKTGTLSGVTGLAGFIGRANGEQFIFSFIFNGSEKKKQRAMDLFEELATYMVTYDGK